MAREQVAIRAAGGVCPAAVFTPAGAGPWRPAIFFMDGIGIRPVLDEMAERLAEAGYVVLLPDLFYRYGPYAPLDAKAVYAQNDFRKALGHLMETTDNRRAAQDTGFFLDYLDGREDVARGKVAVVGYCMGGGMALSAAGTYPERIGAAASIHGGNLANDAEISPHRLAPSIRARVYIGVADNDSSYPPEMAERLEGALRAAGVDYRSVFYPGALHGWTMPDFPMYDEAAAERHWRELVGFFDETLETPVVAR